MSNISSFNFSIFLNSVKQYTSTKFAGRRIHLLVSFGLECLGMIVGLYQTLGPHFPIRTIHLTIKWLAKALVFHSLKSFRRNGQQLSQEKTHYRKFMSKVDCFVFTGNHENFIETNHSLLYYFFVEH